MPINGATQQDTETLIFGAGAQSYSWWLEFENVGGWEHDSEFDAPDGWRIRVTAENPNDDDTITKEIGHAEIMAAVRKIIVREFGARESLRKECKNIIFDVEAADVDANDADAILQVAMFGEFAFC